MVRQAPIHPWSMKLLTIAVSLIGCTAWVKQTISTALRSQIGPRTAAAPIAHSHAKDAKTPLTLTPRFCCDEEPLVSGGICTMCAAELQPLGSGGLHSTSPPVYSLSEGNHHQLLHATTLQTLTSCLRYDAEPQPGSARKLVCAAGHGDLLLCSGFGSRRSVPSCPTSIPTR